MTPNKPTDSPLDEQPMADLEVLGSLPLEAAMLEVPAGFCQMPQTMHV